MAGVIDTNVLLYAANKDAEEHPAALRFLYDIAASSRPWFLTEGILYEFFRVSTHARVFEQPLTWKESFRFIKPFLLSHRFGILMGGQDHWAILEKVLGELVHPSGNLFFDIRTVAVMREHGVREIYTTDTDFLQFKDIKAINPLK